MTTNRNEIDAHNAKILGVDNYNAPELWDSNECMKLFLAHGFRMCSKDKQHSLVLFSDNVFELMQFLESAEDTKVFTSGIVPEWDEACVRLDEVGWGVFWGDAEATIRGELQGAYSTTTRTQGIMRSSDGQWFGVVKCDSSAGEYIVRTPWKKNLGADWDHSYDMDSCIEIFGQENLVSCIGTSEMPHEEL